MYEALGLAEQVGVPGAAKQLGLHESQLYAWRKKARYEASRSGTEKAPAIENAKLKHQVAKQTEEFTLLKKSGRVLRERPDMKRQGLVAKAPKKYKAPRVPAIIGPWLPISVRITFLWGAGGPLPWYFLFILSYLFNRGN